MKLTENAVQHFRKHGFVAVPTFFDARETAAIHAEVERLQREGYLRNVATDGDHHIRCYPPEEQAVHLELPAGGVAFFCYGTPHATGPNTTDHERAGAAFHFLRADYAKDDLIAPDRDYRPYLTGPLATGGV